MTEITISVGLNDAVTKQQEHPTKMYVEIMKNVCKSYHVTFTKMVIIHRKRPLSFVYLTPWKVLWMASQEISAPFSIKNPS